MELVSCPARGWARLRLLAGQVMGMFIHRSRTGSDREGHRRKAGCEPTLGLSTSPGLRAQAWRPSPPSAPATPPAWQRGRAQGSGEGCRVFGVFLPWLSGVSKVSMEPGMAVDSRDAFNLAITLTATV